MMARCLAGNAETKDGQFVHANPERGNRPQCPSPQEPGFWLCAAHVAMSKSDHPLVTRNPLT
jgi:hypothetical protein